MAKRGGFTLNISGRQELEEKIRKAPPHPSQTLAAHFKRPYRNCPHNLALQIWGSPDKIYRLSVLIRTVLLINGKKSRRIAGGRVFVLRDQDFAFLMATLFHTGRLVFDLIAKHPDNAADHVSDVDFPSVACFEGVPTVHLGNIAR
jgi:hypothetical protein